MNTILLGKSHGSGNAVAPEVQEIHWLRDHLPDPKAQREYVREKTAAAISSTIERAMKGKHITRSALAAKLGWEKSQVTRALRGTHNMTIYSLGDLLWGCDLELEDFDKAITRLGVVTVPIDDATQAVGTVSGFAGTVNATFDNLQTVTYATAKSVG